MGGRGHSGAGQNIGQDAGRNTSRNAGRNASQNAGQNAWGPWRGRLARGVTAAVIAGAGVLGVMVPGAPASPTPGAVQPSPGLPQQGPPPPGIAGIAPGRPPAASADGVSPVIFGAQQLPLAFSHARHLALPDAPSCVACHDRAATSRSAVDSLIPGERACRACHAIDRALPRSPAPAPAPPVPASPPPSPAPAPPVPVAPSPTPASPPPTPASATPIPVAPAPAPAPVSPALAASPTAAATACRTCHPAWKPGDRIVARVRIPVPNIKFDHAAHAGRGVPCTTCHGDLRGVDLATRANLPRMRQCLACHDGRRAPDACTTCHLAAPGGLVRTSYTDGQLVPSGSLRGAGHTATFRTDHAMAAKNDPAFCRNCHLREYCADCHSGAVKPMDFHAGDYITTHAVEARRNRPDCSACHRLQTFCVGCHARSGLVLDGRGSEFDPADPMRRFHPAGWADDVRGPNHHAFQAQRNIAQCVSCHREQFCAGCHTAEPGSPRVNPHPRGWANSRRCRSLLSRNPRVCLRCHVDPVELTCEPLGP